MATGANRGGRIRNYWRIAGWSMAAFLLALPLLTNAPWTLSDYVFMGAMFAIGGGLVEITVRWASSIPYRAGVALALLGSFLVIWVNLAVGIVGSENNPANLLFFLALLVGAAVASLGRFRPNALAAATVATALALGIAFAIASTRPTDEPDVPHLLELVGTSVFALLFIGSACLFRRAARG